MKTKILLALDLSVASSGYAFMDYSGKVLETGTIIPAKYKNHTKDRYPVSTIKNINSDVEQFVEIIAGYNRSYDLQDIVIEELNSNKGGQKTIKALAWIHGFLINAIGVENFKYTFMTSAIWRSKLGLKYTDEQKLHNKKLPKRDKNRITFKHLAIIKINEIYGTEFEYEDNDLVEAIGIGVAFLKDKKVAK